MRRDGRTYDEIAVALGYSNKGAAHKAVHRGLSRWMREADEDLRSIELARTDVIISRLMPMVDRDSPDPKDVAALLAVMDFRAKITGLYAPQRHSVGIEVRGQVDVRKLDAYELWDATVAQAVAAQLTPTALVPGDADETETLEEGDDNDSST